MARKEPLRLFLGASESQELTQMANRRKSRAKWVVATHSNEPHIQKAIKARAQGNTVIIHGAKAEWCVKNAILDSVDQKAEKIIVPLKHIRDDYETTTHPSTLFDRARALAILKIHPSFPQFQHRLDIRPKRIWLESLKSENI